MVLLNFNTNFIDSTMLLILPNVEKTLISTQALEPPAVSDNVFVGLLPYLIPMVLILLFLIPQFSFYHLAALYELAFLIICVDLLVFSYMTGGLSVPLFILFIISLTTLESVILLSYLVYRSTKTSVGSLRDLV